MTNLDVNNIDMFLKVRTSAELLVAMWAFKLFDFFVNCVDMSFLKIKCSIGIAINWDSLEGTFEYHLDLKTMLKFMLTPV